MGTVGVTHRPKYKDNVNFKTIVARHISSCTRVSCKGSAIVSITNMAMSALKSGRVLILSMFYRYDFDDTKLAIIWADID